MSETHVTEFHLTIAGITDQEAEEIYREILGMVYGQDVVEAGYVHTDLVGEADHGEKDTL